MTNTRFLLMLFIVGFVFYGVVVHGQTSTTTTTYTETDPLDASGIVSPVTNVQEGDSFVLTITQADYLSNGTRTSAFFIDLGWTINVEVLSVPDSNGIGKLSITYYEADGHLNSSSTRNFSWYEWGNPYVYTDVTGWKTFLTSETWNNETITLNPTDYTNETIHTEFLETENAFGSLIYVNDTYKYIHDGGYESYSWTSVIEIWYDKATGKTVKIRTEYTTKVHSYDGSEEDNVQIIEGILEGFEFGDSNLNDSTTEPTSSSPLLDLPSPSFLVIGTSMLIALLVKRKQ